LFRRRPRAGGISFNACDSGCHAGQWLSAIAAIAAGVLVVAAAIAAFSKRQSD
jgi:hypothetical protein